MKRESGREREREDHDIYSMSTWSYQDTGTQKEGERRYTYVRVSINRRRGGYKETNNGNNTDTTAMREIR